jgi:hypothetical protein
LKASPIDWVKLKTISGLKDKVDELEQQIKEKIKKNKQNMEDLWDTI